MDKLMMPVLAAIGLALAVASGLNPRREQLVLTLALAVVMGAAHGRPKVVASAAVFGVSALFSKAR